MHRDHIITIDIRVLNFSEDIQKIKSSALNTRIEDFENTNYRSTILIDVFRLTKTLDWTPRAKKNLHALYISYNIYAYLL